MSWKRCDGCTRAIPETADTCGYCGHAPADSLESLVSELISERDSVRAHDDVAELASVDLALSAVAPPLSVQEFAVEEPAVPERVPAAAAAPSTTPVPPATPAAAVKPGARMRPRDMAAVALGVVAGGGLIFTLFSMRGAASPDGTPAAVPQPAKKPVAAAARPAPARQAGAAPAPAAAPASTSAPAHAAARSVVAAPPMPHWTPSEEGHWLPAGPKNFAVEVPAANKVHIWTRDVTPVLVVRCLAGAVDVFVVTHSAVRMEPQDQDHTVRLTLDGGGERVERWPDSDSHDALFARNGAAFVQELSAVRTLRFGFTPHNAEPAVARFDVSGLSEQLAPAARQCSPQPARTRKSVRATAATH